MFNVKIITLKRDSFLFYAVRPSRCPAEQNSLEASERIRGSVTKREVKKLNWKVAASSVELPPVLQPWLDLTSSLRHVAASSPASFCLSRCAASCEVRKRMRASGRVENRVKIWRLMLKLRKESCVKGQNFVNKIKIFQNCHCEVQVECSTLVFASFLVTMSLHLLSLDPLSYRKASL